MALDPVSLPRALTIGTRSSVLALAQTRVVESYLSLLTPAPSVRLHTLSVAADKNTNTPLHQLATTSKGLWTEELEALLLDGTLDLIVHSLKDMPTSLPAGCAVGAILEREDPRDAVVLRKDLVGKYKGLADLPAGSRVGTSSVRRMAQLKRAFPGLELVDSRGNLSTRVNRKLDEEKSAEAVILAVAGLKRLGREYEERIVEYLEAPKMLHAVGQGAIGVEIREGDAEVARLLGGLKHEKTTWECLAERALLRTLEGGCSVPVGVQTKWEGEELELMAVVASNDGAEVVEIVEKGAIGSENEAETFGVKVAEGLVDAGARKILESVKAKKPTTKEDMKD